MLDLRLTIEQKKTQPFLEQVGLWLKKNQSAIVYIQWSVVVVYLLLLIIPAIVPLPPEQAKIHDNWVRFAQFVFWGIWWPGVILSMLLFGRLWCGLLCPEGSLTEFASRHGRGKKRPIPKWIKWQGWPFVAFALTTVYGQLVSVYDYALPTLLILGGSTVAAIIVGYLWGKERRVWCRFLCPVNGVFALLSRLAPMHFYTDRKQWANHGKTSEAPVVCAPMISIMQLDSNSHCHMCGRCTAYRDAITFKQRSPNSEILSNKKQLTRWEQRLLVFGVFGLALAAFQWTVSPWFVQLKLLLAEWVVDHEWWWLLQESNTWWILTAYPTENDVFNYLDGITIMLFLTVYSLCMGGCIYLLTQLSARLLATDLNEKQIWDLGWLLTEILTPLAAFSLFLGLSMITVILLTADGYQLLWLDEFRMAVLGMAGLWSIYLAWCRVAQFRQAILRKFMGFACLLVVIGLLITQWCLVFFIW